MIAAFDYLLVTNSAFNMGTATITQVFRRPETRPLTPKYVVAPEDFCPEATARNFSSIKEADDFTLFDLPRTACR
jgi:hypothetical protein